MGYADQARQMGGQGTDGGAEPTNRGFYLMLLLLFCFLGSRRISSSRLIRGNVAISNICAAAMGWASSGLSAAATPQHKSLSATSCNSCWSWDTCRSIRGVLFDHDCPQRAGQIFGWAVWIFWMVDAVGHGRAEQYTDDGMRRSRLLFLRFNATAAQLLRRSA